MLFAVSDVVWQACIGGVVTIVLAFMQYRTKMSVDKGISNNVDTARIVAENVEQVKATAQVAADKVEEVKAALTDTNTQTKDKLDDLAKTANATHTLVNSNFGVILKTASIALHRVAELTGHADDITAASSAQKALDDHESKQATIDAMKKE
jgi:hypothetical protein